MSALSRRTTGASAATLVPVLTVSAAAPSDTTLLALESRWLAACAEEKRLHDEWRAIYDSLPTNQYAWGKSPARLARIRAECRERVRWWIASRRDIKRQEEATGIVEANERDEEAYKITSGIEDQILAAPAAGIEGLRVKLAVLARMSFTQFSDADGNSLPDEEWDANDLAVMKLHAEAEWIAGRAKA
jgi:hypothetical protein